MLDISLFMAYRSSSVKQSVRQKHGPSHKQKYGCQWLGHRLALFKDDMWTYVFITIEKPLIVISSC